MSLDGTEAGDTTYGPLKEWDQAEFDESFAKAS